MMKYYRLLRHLVHLCNYTPESPCQLLLAWLITLSLILKIFYLLFLFCHYPFNDTHVCIFWGTNTLKFWTRGLEQRCSSEFSAPQPWHPTRVLVHVPDVSLVSSPLPVAWESSGRWFRSLGSCTNVGGPGSNSWLPVWGQPSSGHSDYFGKESADRRLLSFLLSLCNFDFQVKK